MVAQKWNSLADIRMIYGSPCGGGSRVGFGVERIDPLCFLAGCHTRRLNQALSVLSVTIGFLSVLLLFIRATFCVNISLRLYVFCLLVVLVMLSIRAK